MTPSEATPPSGEQMESDKMSVLSVNVSTATPGTALRGSNETLNASQIAHASDLVTSDGELPQQVKRHCRPKMMPVSMPAPLGPKLFILGEPVLHRYYTVYDWTSESVGFGLAASRRNMGTHLIGDSRGELPHEVEVLLMQKTAQVKRKEEDQEDEDAIFVQVQVVAMKVTRR